MNFTTTAQGGGGRGEGLKGSLSKFTGHQAASNTKTKPTQKNGPRGAHVEGHMSEEAVFVTMLEPHAPVCHGTISRFT